MGHSSTSSAFEPRRRNSLLYTGVNRTGFLGDLIAWELPHGTTPPTPGAKKRSRRGDVR